MGPGVFHKGKVMRCMPTALKEVIVIEPDVFEDVRGYFLETYHEKRYVDAGIRGRFVQDNFSKSPRGTLRGLHYQLQRPQGKLVTVLEGSVYDVAVDIRRGSPTFGCWVGIELSAQNKRQLYIPAGFAHGFYVLSEIAGLLYKCTEVYSPKDERGIIWNDSELSISWPGSEPLLSAKDAAYKSLAEMGEDLPVYHAAP